MHPNYWTQVLATLYLFAIVPPFLINMHLQLLA